MSFAPQMKRAATFATLLLLTQFSAFAQDSPRAGSTPQQSGPRGTVEVPDTEEQRRFVKEHSFDNPSFRRKQSEMANGAAAQTPAQGARQVRVIYLVPSDKNIRADYQNETAKAISDLQRFYKDQLGGGAPFSRHAPTVEAYKPPHTSAFYPTGDNARAGGFFEGV